MRRHGDISSDGCTEGPHADQVSVPESINGKIHALNAAFQGAFELRVPPKDELTSGQRSKAVDLSTPADFRMPGVAETIDSQPIFVEISTGVFGRE